MKILFVDDSLQTLKAVAASLNSLGHTVVTTQYPKQAVSLFQSEHPGLIILDILMPEMDGFECAKQLRKVSQKDEWVPIIFLSCLEDIKHIIHAIAVGGDDYLIKPANELLLDTKIKSLQRISTFNHALHENNQALKKNNVTLNRLSLTDKLTGVYNRRAFDTFFKKEWKHASRLRKTDRSISLIMIDVDHFKEINDSMGHLIGDYCLQHIANCIQKALPRDNDYLFRYGGDEFAVILPNTDKKGALAVAERLKESVENEMIPNLDMALTISLGVATQLATKNKTHKTLHKKADKALYKSKKSGRNCVSN